jgi:hypothetical protein
MTYTVLVKLEDSIVILGIKAETEEVARELAQCMSFSYL